MSIHKHIYLSPQTIGELPETERETQSLFIHYWQKIVGPWYSISSGEKPHPIRLVAESEITDKNSQFWQALIRELLMQPAKLPTSFIEEISPFLKIKTVNMPYQLGKQLLYHLHSLNKQLDLK